MTSALAPRPSDSLARAERPGFLDGTRALFSGLGFLARTPAMWPLAMVPLVIASAATAALGSGAAALIFPWIAAKLGAHAWLVIFAKVLAGVLLAIVAALAGLAVAQPLSGPALNRIVRRVEADMGAPEWPPTGFVADVGRALSSILVGYAFGLPLLAVLALVSFFVPPASVITFPLKLVVLALLLSWDFLDYPLSARGTPVRARVALVVRHARTMIGFGFGLALLSLIPCAGLLALPIGVAGAARLTRQIEQWEAENRR
jgi:CysZ protein